MVVAVRAEAVITAQNKLRPGLAQAAAELSRFRAMQTKATSAFAATAGRVGAAASQRMQAASAALSSRIAMAGRSQALTLGGPAALAASYKQYADIDRQITNIGITADASADDLAGVRKQIEGIAYETAQSSGKVTGGLEVLVAQGRTLKESLEFLPSVARTAAASNSAVADIAKTADSVGSNFKIAGREMQTAFDIMAAGGKAGQFELKDMSQYLPELAPAAAAAGFTGTRGLSQLVSMMQVVRKGSGSSSAAFDSMNNILQKMESQETQTKFKKFGVDLAAGMAKGRKEGRNLVEVFEELTARAVKGDLSKLPQLFTDLQFARGMRALMTYRGEWQKLDKVISSTAAGTVARDLTRVTNDARAQIDRMFSAIENRAVQLGGLLAKVILPLDEAAKRIERGENQTVNRIQEFARFTNANVIAKAEISGAADRNEYDPEFRKLVDARKEMLTREAIEKERARLADEIAKLEGKKAEITGNSGKGGMFDWLRGDTSRDATQKALDAVLAKEKRQGYLSHFDKTNKKMFEDRLGTIAPLDSGIAAAQSQLAELNALVAKIDELNLQLAEKQGEMGSALKPRMSQAVGEVKSEISGLGAAGQTAGSQLADGFSQGLSRMENEAKAAIARIQQQLSALRAPSLSINGIVAAPAASTPASRARTSALSAA